MRSAISSPPRFLRMLLGLIAVALFVAVAVADPAGAAAAVPHAGPLALSDPSWVDGYTLHAVGVSTMAAAVAVPKGTLAKVRAAIKSFLPDTATDAEVDAALASELGESDPVTPPPVNTPVTTDNPADLAAAIQAAVTAAVAPLQAEVNTLQGALQAEAGARTAAQTAIETQRAAERTTTIDTLLTAAVGDGRITPAKRDEWKTRLEGGYDTVKPILDEMAPNPALAKAAGKVTADTSGKTPEKTAADRPAPGSMAGSVPSAALDYVTANTN